MSKQKRTEDSRGTDPADALLEVGDAMEELHVSRSTIERRFRDGSLRRLKVGRRTLVRRRDLLGLVREA